jgi:hypothetical protein
MEKSVTHAPSLRAAGLALCLAGAAACGGGQQPAGSAPGPVSPTGAAPTTDAPIAASQLVPPGFGTLRQDDIAVRLDLQGYQIKLIPLDETVIRLLSPDSYRALRDLQESRRTDVASAARRNGLQQYRIWYVSFYGLAPEVRFSPNEVTLTNNGRDFRPLDVLTVTAGFGENRLQQRQTQAALYLFDGALDASQPVVVHVESAVDANSWSSALQRIARERALGRSRAASATAPRP